MHKVRIHSPGQPVGSWIEIDGKRLDQVVHVAFEVGVEKAPTVTVTLYCELELDGEAAIKTAGEPVPGGWCA